MSDKQLKILCRFLIWLSIALLITFIGISNIFALETKTIYSVNNDGTLASANTYNYGYLTGGGTQGSATANVNTTISGVAYGFNFQFYENVVLNKTYTLVINFMDIDLLKTFNSSMVQVSTCNNTTCNENTLVSVIKSNNNGNSNKLTIQFNPITTGPIILVNLGSEQPITGVSTFGIKSVTLDSTNQNQEIIDNQTNNTNNIINNNNSNTQEIIDNQNQNTQDLIDSKYSCNTQTINLYKYATTTGYLTNIGTQSTNSSYQTTSFIKLKENTNYEIALNFTMGSPAYCLYDNKQQLISCTSFNSSTSITFNSGSANFVKISLRKDTNNTRTATLYGNICLNDSEEQTNAINNLNDNINSTDYDISGLDNVVGWLPAGPVDSILNLPLNLFNAYTTALGLTCSPLNIPLPYINKNLPIPCIRSIFDEIGISTWWEGFGYLAAAIILYNYLLSLYNWVDKTLTLRENTMPGYYDDNFGGGA